MLTETSLCPPTTRLNFSIRAQSKQLVGGGTHSALGCN
jgi:hypothetical protein